MRRLREALAPLRSRDFVLVWLGQSISTLGNSCFDIALIWLILDLTGSTVVIGSVLTATYIPTIALLAFGGVWADRASRKGTVLWSDLLRAIVTLAFALVVTEGRISLGAIFGLALFYGLVSAFFNPAISALIPSLVPPSQYVSANALGLISSQIATLLGPALGGYLISKYNVGAALAFDGATFVASVLTLLFLNERRIRQAAGKLESPSSTRSTNRDDADPGRSSWWVDFQTGVRFLWGEKGMLTMILIFSLTNGINDVEAVLTPVLARSTLHLTAVAFGLLASFFGVGALGGALLMGLFGQHLRHRAVAICGSLATFGLAIGAMGLAQSAADLYVAYLVSGTSFIVAEIASSSLWQQIIPNQILGRVFGVMVTLAMGMNPLGLILAGVLGQVFGVRQGLWIGGGAIVILSVLAFTLPMVRALDVRLQPYPVETT
jgi:MFS transporter, DHA3 family, macrolide efflux protein